MKVINIFISLLMAVSLGLAQNINISGKVIDSAGAPVEGVKVALEKSGNSVITGTNGSFLISGSVNIHTQLRPSGSQNLSAEIKRGFLTISVCQNSLLEVTTFSIKGQSLFSVKKFVEAGYHSISLFHHGSGIYFHRVRAGNNEIVLKSNSSGNMSPLTVSFVDKKESGIYSKRQMLFEDVIRLTKMGYLNYRLNITNSDTSGLEIKMVLQDAGTVTDIDGNEYHAIKLGNQVWTVENLRTTRYNDGSAISLVTGNQWASLTSGAYCYYGNDDGNKEKYGALYNWYTVNTGKLAPEGWHVPSYTEWDELQKYLIAEGYNYDGTITGNKAGKSLASKTDWNSCSTPGTVGNDMSSNNSSGFTGLPGGYRFDDGNFVLIGSKAGWWISGETGRHSRYHFLDYNYHMFNRDLIDKKFGLSVRLIKD